MGFEKGKKRTGGRAQGTPNKTTMAVKQAFQHAFDEMGGTTTLAAWAKKNQSEFYKLYARLIPQDSTPLTVTIEQKEPQYLQGAMKEAAIEELLRISKKFKSPDELKQKTKR